MVWFFAGLIVFGLLTGGLTGMSKSPVVSAVLPLLFTFAGGSVVTLSMAEGRTPDDLELLGQQLVAFGGSTALGVFLGILLRKADRGLPFSGKSPG